MDDRCDTCGLPFAGQPGGDYRVRRQYVGHSALPTCQDCVQGRGPRAPLGSASRKSEPATTGEKIVFWVFGIAGVLGLVVYLARDWLAANWGWLVFWPVVGLIALGSIFGDDDDDDDDHRPRRRRSTVGSALGRETGRAINRMFR